MLSDGNRSIYFTTDGNAKSTTNCIGRLFGASNQMYLDFYSNFMFRSSDLANLVVNPTFNISFSNSTFYSPLTINNTCTVYCIFLVSSTSSFTDLLTTTNGIKNSDNLLMHSNGTKSIYFTSDGNALSTTNW